MSARARLALAVCLAACNQGTNATVDAATGAHADGTVGAWSTLTPLPLPRANHCAAVVGGWLLVIGGNYLPPGATDFKTIDAIHAAPLQPDGSLGPWQQAGKTPSPVYECTATGDASRLYIVDGIYDDMTSGGQVWAADLSTAGMLSALTSISTLPAGANALYADAWVHGSTLYAATSNLDKNMTGTLHAPITGNSLGSWNEDDWRPGFVGHPQYAFTGSYFFVLGGYQSADAGLVAIPDVSGAPLNSSGMIGSRFKTISLDAPTAFGTAIAVDDYLFIVGGKEGVFSAPGVATVESAHVGSNGQLDTWTAQTSLPAGRTNHAIALGGDFLYVTGGGMNGPGLDTVYSARVRK